MNIDEVKLVEIWSDDCKVGRLALTDRGLCAFEYDTDFIRTGYSISPYYLPLRAGVFIAKPAPFRGGFGVFDDSMPDGWGSLILDRYLREHGIDPERLTILQRLSLIGSTGRGALEYRPDRSVSPTGELPDFDRLAAETEKILTSDYTGGCLDTLYREGGSPGGARPKVFVRIDGREWLVKFKATNDPKDIGRIEYEYSLLAAECGIEMPETQLFEGKYYGVERFDRTQTGKVHTISAAGLLHADYRIPSLDYDVLLKVCRQLTRDAEQTYELFRRMVFNIAIGNRDDHAKNFSFQFTSGGWRLAPAYDLLPSSGFNGQHTTTINGSGTPTLSDIRQVAKEAGLLPKRTETIIEQVTETCRKAGRLDKIRS